MFALADLRTQVVLGTHVGTVVSVVSNAMFAGAEANVFLAQSCLLTDVALLLQDDATDAKWYDVTKLPPLAFDHKLMVRTAFEHLLKHPETKSTGTALSHVGAWHHWL